ncbi:MAG: flippase-like domain-containing protein [Saprospiraceae bacterium]|nr:flippase-like domain-containing protein [Saprospiraceae bacterium]
MWSKLLKIALFFILGIATLYLVFYTQQKQYQGDLLQSMWHDVSSANLFYAGLAAAAFMLSNVLRSLRWHLLLAPIGCRPRLVNSLGAIMIAYLTNLAIPRAGEIARATVISRHEDVDFDKALGTILMDRLIDLICLGIIGLLTLFFAYDRIMGYFETHLDIGNMLFSTRMTGLMLFLAAMGLFWGLLFVFRSHWKNHRVVVKLTGFFKGLWTGITSVRQLRQKGLFLFYSTGIWFLYFLMAYLMFKTLPATAHLGLIAGLVVFFFGSLGIVFPSPGGMGSYHFLAIQSLSLYQISGPAAFTYANLNFFTIQVFTIGLFGILSMVVLPLYNKSGKPS